MNRFNKILIGFSIAYWFCIAVGIILFALAFEKVPIGQYGLRVNYFSPTIDNSYYTNGLYYKDVGYYFVTYPSTKQYILNQKVTVTNSDLEEMEVSYSVCFKINPAHIYTMYNSIAMSYRPRIIAIVNNVISSYCKGITQAESRLTIQSQVAVLYNSVGITKMDAVFSGGVALEAIWINQIDFKDPELEAYYDTAYIYSSSQSEQYEAAAFNLSIANLEKMAVQSVIQNTVFGFQRQMEIVEADAYEATMSEQQTDRDQNLVRISALYNVSRVMNVS